MYEIAALIPSSAKLRNPSKFVAVVFNPKTSAPKQSMRILREKNPRTKTRTLKNKETRAFLMLCTVRFISAIGLKLVSTQFRASPFKRALFSALNRVLLIN